MDTLTIAEAAAKYGVDEKRLRGAVWQENQTGRLELPIGDAKADTVQDDAALARWVKAQRG